MKNKGKIEKGVYLLYLVMLFLTFQGFCQQREDPLETKYKDAAREIMTNAGYCALITNDAEGAPRVRAMDPFLPDDNFIVWLGTNPKSRKVSQIRKDSRVTLYYLNKDATGYVTIRGLAEIVNDSTDKETYWKEGWENFYPDKDEGYLLIKVVPQWLEVISESQGITGDSTTWQPPKVRF